MWIAEARHIPDWVSAMGAKINKSDAAKPAMRAVSLSLFTNVSRDPALPTSEETTNERFGETDDPDRRAGRWMGNLFSPLGGKIGAIEDAARIATQKGAAISTAQQAIKSPAGRADEILARSLSRDKLSPENAAQALQQFGDKPLSVVDIAGPATARKARAVNTLGADGNDMSNFLGSRQAEQHTRVADDVAANLSQGGDLYSMNKRMATA